MVTCKPHSAAQARRLTRLLLLPVAGPPPAGRGEVAAARLTSPATKPQSLATASVPPLVTSSAASAGTELSVSNLVSKGRASERVADLYSKGCGQAARHLTTIHGRAPPSRETPCSEAPRLW